MVRERERGQAALEAALTLPLALFVILGTLQLFLMLQARLLAQYAAFRAVRAGSLNHGSCESMTHAAIAVLLPSIAPLNASSSGGGTMASRLGQAFAARSANRFAPALDGGHDGTIVWIHRDHPLAPDIAGAEDTEFDDPNRPLMRLEVEMIYWYPMRIPFANWVMLRMMLAHFALQGFTGTNPLLATQRNAGWPNESTASLPDPVVAQEMASLAAKGQYAFPIAVRSAMRMMTPARAAEFAAAACPPAPTFGAGGGP